MSDFEHELLDLLEKDVKFDPAREEVLRLQITSEFKKKKRRLMIWYVVYHVVALVILVPGLSQVLHSTDQLEAIRGVAFLILGAILLIVIKLWYVINRGRLEVMRELKRLELRLVLDRRPAQPQQNPAG
ncbi:MAG TPA: DUF6768 family protein [Phycisphaerae bacterium]|nr:DUF6768 family protein [Phycisphaerae bacterium]